MVLKLGETVQRNIRQAIVRQTHASLRSGCLSLTKACSSNCPTPPLPSPDFSSMEGPETRHSPPAIRGVACSPSTRCPTGAFGAPLCRWTLRANVPLDPSRGNGCVASFGPVLPLPPPKKKTLTWIPTSHHLQRGNRWGRIFAGYMWAIHKPP